MNDLTHSLPENGRIEILTHSVTETEAVGRDLAALLERSGRHPAFIAMRGEMGVGKTAFVRGFASYFGASNVKSPTYTVVNEYRGSVPLFHFDFYRIEDEDDLTSVGYDDYLRRGGYCLAEWSENIQSAIPEDAVTVEIRRDPVSEEARHICILFPTKEITTP